MHAHGDAWLTLTHGEKLWLVFPPGGLPPPAGSTNVSAELAGRLALQNAATVLKIAASNGELDAMMETDGLSVCVQRPGETVYLPALWHHATANLGVKIPINLI